MDTYKISFLFNKPLKNYDSLYFATFFMKWICHTLEALEQHTLNWLNSFSKAFLKIYYFPNLIATTCILKKWLTAQFLTIFNNIATSFEPQVLRTIFWSLFKYIKNNTRFPKRHICSTIEINTSFSIFSNKDLRISKSDLTILWNHAMKLVTQNYQKKWLFQEMPAPTNTQVQVPRWPSNFATKF